MIAITKEEKNVLHAELPSAHIVRTMKQKSKRHRYYCEETRPVLYVLERLRGEPVGEHRSERSAYGADRTRRR